MWLSSLLWLLKTIFRFIDAFFRATVRVVHDVPGRGWDVVHEVTAETIVMSTENKPAPLVVIVTTTISRGGVNFRMGKKTFLSKKKEEQQAERK